MFGCGHLCGCSLFPASRRRRGKVLACILVGIRARSLARVGVGVGFASAGGMAGSLVHDCDGVGWGRSQGR